MPPSTGTATLDRVGGQAPVLDVLQCAALEVPGIDVLQLLFEVDGAHLLEVLPGNLHPTIPPTATIVVWNCPEGPLGPFRLAQVRAGCRAGFRSRGYLLASYCDSEEAGRVLRSHWGFDCRAGEITFARHFDGTDVSVAADGEVILRASLQDPIIVPPTDVEWTGNLNRALVRDGAERLRLVQAEPDYNCVRSERGRPQLELFNNEAWNAAGVDPLWPVSAVNGHGDLRLAPVRYLIDPALPLQQGTERVEG